MSEQVFIRLRGRIQGPYSPDQLQSLARRGQFSRSHEVSADGVHWARATTRPELFPPAKSEGPSEFLTMLDEALVADKPPVVTPPPTNVWHYHQLGKTHGPVDFTHLQYLVSSGQVLVDDMVWQEGLPEWLPAGRVPGLVKVLTASGSMAGTPTIVTAVSPQYGVGDYPRVSSLAVASLVLGILWIGGLGSVLAIIFGSISLYQIRASRGRLTGTGMAIAGFVLGIVMISLQVILIIVDEANRPGFNW